MDTSLCGDDESSHTYNKKEFKLDTHKDILDYWYYLQSVCLNTIIDDWNMNAFMDDKEKLMTKAITKAARLKKYLIGKSVDEIADDGVIPGNNLGGGGLDTVFWSH